MPRDGKHRNRGRYMGNRRRVCKHPLDAAQEETETVEVEFRDVELSSSHRRIWRHEFTLGLRRPTFATQIQGHLRKRGVINPNYVVVEWEPVLSSGTIKVVCKGFPDEKIGEFVVVDKKEM